jgi:hypothetical protein
VGGGPALIVALAVCGLGGWRIARAHAFGAAVLVTPLLLQGPALAVAGVGMHPRYFAIALPVLLLAGASGFGAVVEHVVAWLPNRPLLRSAFARVALTACTALSAVPLARYYQYPKQDYLGAARFVDRHAAPGDARLTDTFTGYVLREHYGLAFTAADSLPDLARAERAGTRVWVVTSLERVLTVRDSAFMDYLHAHYRRAETFPGTVGDGAVRVYVRERLP